MGWLASEVNAWLQARADARFDPKVEADAKSRRTPSIWARTSEEVVRELGLSPEFCAGFPAIRKLSGTPVSASDGTVDGATLEIVADCDQHVICGEG